MSLDVEFPYQSVNSESLDASLKAALGARVFGHSLGTTLRVHLADDASEQEVRAVQQTVAAHDPMVQTLRQQKQIDIENRTEAARVEMKAEFNSDAYLGTPYEELARRLHWLELEIRRLHGLYG